MKKLLNAVVLIAIVVGAYFALETFKGKNTEEVKPEIIRPVKTLVLNGNDGYGRWRYYGTLQGGKRVSLSFRVSGTIKSILVENGTKVKKGDLLATLDTRDFQTQLRQAESSQAQAQAQYNDAVANFKRYENLYKQKVVSRAQYDTYKTQVDVTLAALNAAKAQTASVRDSLKDTNLRAPFEGIIADRTAENFQEITARETIFSLQDISTMEVVFNIPDSDILWLSSSAEKLVSIQAHFDALPGKVFPLKLKEFVVQADPNTNTFPVTAVMPPVNDVALLPGMAASVEVETHNAKNESSSFIVPMTALTDQAESKTNFVWLCKNGAVTRIPVKVGLPHNNGMIEISGKDIHSGEYIVVAGTHLLKEGQKVRLMN